MPTPPTSGSPPPAMAVSYLDCTSAIGIGTYLTLMSGYFFSKSLMISVHTAVRGPPLLSQKVISPLPLPSVPLSLPSSPQAVAVSASTAARETAAAARPRCVFEMFMIGSSLSVVSVGAHEWGVRWDPVPPRPGRFGRWCGSR